MECLSKANTWSLHQFAKWAFSTDHSLAFESANVAHDPWIEEGLIYTVLCQVFRFDHSYRCCLWQNLVISTAVNTVVTQNFSIKKHILLPTLNSSYLITSKYIRVGLLAVSRFSRIQF